MGGPREEGKAEIFAVHWLLQSWQSYLEPFLLTWLHASAQDLFCYSRKPTETTHTPHPPSGRRSRSSPHPESPLAVTIMSGRSLSPAVLPVTANKLLKAEGAAESSQPSFWHRSGPGSCQDKKKKENKQTHTTTEKLNKKATKHKNHLCLLEWGEAHPISEGRNVLPGGKHHLLGHELKPLLWGSRCASLLPADAEAWRWFSCLPLTPCPKDEEINTLLILRLTEILQSWKTTYC